jgi:hypothetical protein
MGITRWSNVVLYRTVTPTSTADRGHCLDPARQKYRNLIKIAVSPPWAI